MRSIISHFTIVIIHTTLSCPAGIEYLTETAIKSADLKNKTLTTEDGTAISFEKLVIGTGARVRAMPWWFSGVQTGPTCHNGMHACMYVSVLGHFCPPEPILKVCWPFSVVLLGDPAGGLQDSRC